MEPKSSAGGKGGTAKSPPLIHNPKSSAACSATEKELIKRLVTRQETRAAPGRAAPFVSQGQRAGKAGQAPVAQIRTLNAHEKLQSQRDAEHTVHALTQLRAAPVQFQYQKVLSAQKHPAIKPAAPLALPPAAAIEQFSRKAPPEASPPPKPPSALTHVLLAQQRPTSSALPEVEREQQPPAQKKSKNANSNDGGVSPDAVAWSQKSLAEQRRREARKETPITLAEVKMSEREMGECTDLVMCFLSGEGVFDEPSFPGGGTMDAKGGDIARDAATSRYVDDFQHDTRNHSLAYHYSVTPLLGKRKK